MHASFVMFVVTGCSTHTRMLTFACLLTHKGSRGLALRVVQRLNLRCAPTYRPIVVVGVQDMVGVIQNLKLTRPEGAGAPKHSESESGQRSVQYDFHDLLTLVAVPDDERKSRAVLLLCVIQAAVPSSCLCFCLSPLLYTHATDQ